MRSAHWLAVAAALATGAAGDALAQHSGLKWNGPGTCLQCHTGQALEVHGSAHYQWEGAAPYQVDGAPEQGKLKTALNSYCVNVLGNWGACGSCHVGLGATPTRETSLAQLQNIDCLICHQDKYRRKRGASGLFVADTASMPINMDQAVQTVHKPTRAACLQCHGRGGGGDNYKRGDLAVAHGSTTDRNFDVHMSTRGANLTCQKCHRVSDHRIAGRGSDLRQTDLDVTLSCANASCHRDKASGGAHESSAITQHTARVACQTCHVTTFARNAADTPASEATEMHRDWAAPRLTASGAIHPTPTLLNNVRPVYRFWNRFSDNYSLGEIAVVDATTGFYPTSRPVGDIADTNPANKLYPFKYKTASQPYAPGRGVMIPVDTRVYFATGDLASATRAGLVNFGLSPDEPWEMVTTDAFQLITHEVQPEEQALGCTKCHGRTATQMNLPALGYTLKASTTTLCVRCHKRMEARYDWQKIHTKHVTDKKLDCAHCHNFSRPERGLR